jgi:hypothetical protein
VASKKQCRGARINFAREEEGEGHTTYSPVHSYTFTLDAPKRRCRIRTKATPRNRAGTLARHNKPAKVKGG